MSRGREQGFGEDIAFAGVDFTRAEKADVIDWLKRRSLADAFAYVVTPNADHVVRLHDHPGQGEMADAYREADLCLVDSRVMAVLARLRGIDLPVIPGSDLIEAFLCRHIEPGRRLLLVGGADESAVLLRRLLPDNEIVQHQPPMGLLGNPQAMADCVRFVVENPCDYVLFAVGSPQQELIAWRVAQSGGARGTGLCIGAAVDFVTGRSRRAPVWMRRLALEWLHRLLSNPRRLWRRYLLHSPRIFWIALTR